jgi:hypothetical protein
MNAQAHIQRRGASPEPLERRLETKWFSRSHGHQKSNQVLVFLIQGEMLRGPYVEHLLRHFVKLKMFSLSGEPATGLNSDSDGS